MDIALDIAEKDSSFALELFFAVTWSIWWNRNQALYEDLGAPPTQIWEMANRILGDYKEACSYSNLPLVPSLTKWRAPPTGFIKINVDGTASDDGRPSSIGVIIRDSQGSSIATSNRVLSSPFPAETIEALAIQAVNKGNVGGEFGHIIQNIRDLSSSFSWYLFQHLKRDGNKVAHDLAKAARMSGVSQVWKGVIPSFVEHLILEDRGL